MEYKENESERENKEVMDEETEEEEKDEEDADEKEDGKVHMKKKRNQRPGMNDCLGNGERH
jgi:hypothetical protein